MYRLSASRSIPSLCKLNAVVARRALVCCIQRLSNHASSPAGISEEDRKLIDLRECSVPELRKLVRQLPAHRDSATPAHITVLGTGSNELSPSFILKCYSRCYRFNLGESFMRMLSCYRFHVSKDPLTLFTRACWENCGGAGLMYYSEEDVREKQSYVGPSKMQQMMRYVQQFTGRHTWIHSSMEPCGNADIHVYKDRNVIISMIPIDQATDGGTVVAYACKLCDSPGKFSLEKAEELGIPRSPVYTFLTQGYDVITPQGDLVHHSQVVGEGKKGPTFLVVDCPSESFSGGLISNQYLQPEYYEQRGEEVALIVHITPLEVMQSDGYCQWMAGFEDSTQHLLIHSSLCPGEMGYQKVNKFNLPLHLLNPKVYAFPCLVARNIVDKSSLKISHSVSEDSLILGRMFMKYTLKPDIRVDESDCLISFEEQLKSDLNSVIGNKEVYRKILKHRRALQNHDAIEPSSVLQSALKTECSVAPADSDDAVVTILGTSSAFPSTHRSCSGVLIQTQRDGHFLLDCGEGTLQQLYQRFGMKEAQNILRNLNAIFISHLHPDHHIGMISVLNQVHALTKDTDPYVKLISSPLQYSIFEETQVCDSVRLNPIKQFDLVKSPYLCSDSVTMETVPVKHIRGSYGCVLRKKGKWSIVYSGDTAPCKGLVEAGQNATLLIHEATFEDRLKEEARLRNHCTYSDAVKIGQAMNAKFTITTHFSARAWWFPMMKRYWKPGVTPAIDLMTVRLSDIHSQQLDSTSSCSALNAISSAQAEPYTGRNQKSKQ